MPWRRAYNAALRRELRRKRGGKPWPLQDWNDHPEHGTLRLIAQPQANTFSLSVTHAEFTADLNVTYDIDLAELDSGTIAGFKGSIPRRSPAPAPGSMS